MRNSIDPNDNRTLQFELWQECNNHCDYCYLGSENRMTADDVKLISLKKTYENICDMSNYPKYNCIGFIGGEFFQGQLKNPEVKSWFYKVMQKTAELYNSEVLRQVWISATLDIGPSNDLFECLKLFDNCEGIWVTTSWDTIGRFKTEKMVTTWENNIKRLKETFPKLRINVTTILTGDFIDRYLNDEFTIQSLIDKYHVSFFFKQCGSIAPWTTGDEQDVRESKIKSNQILPNFYPTRGKFIRFLTKFRMQESEDLWNRLFNIQYRADDLVRNFNDGHSHENHRQKHARAEDISFRILDCGHPASYQAYIDSNKCCLCDKIRIAAMMQ